MIYGMNDTFNRFSKVIVALLLSLILSFASASFNVYEFDNAEHEARFQHLITLLRCPKCQNNNLADSNAPLATDIKNYVFESIKDNKTDDEIIDFLISRYGYFIIYSPRDIWIWVTPFAIGLFGLFWVLRHVVNKKPDMSQTIPSMASLITEHEKSKEKTS